MYKIAIVGDKDSVLAFKILGVDVYISLDAQEARKIIDRIPKKAMELSLLQSKWQKIFLRQ